MLPVGVPHPPLCSWRSNDGLTTPVSMGGCSALGSPFGNSPFESPAGNCVFNVLLRAIHETLPCPESPLHDRSRRPLPAPPLPRSCTTSSLSCSPPTWAPLLPFPHPTAELAEQVFPIKDILDLIHLPPAMTSVFTNLILDSLYPYPLANPKPIALCCSFYCHLLCFSIISLRLCHLIPMFPHHAHPYPISLSYIFSFLTSPSPAGPP